MRPGVHEITYEKILGDLCRMERMHEKWHVILIREQDVNRK